MADGSDPGPDGGIQAATMLAELVDLDQAVYRAIAETPTPTLDLILRRLTVAADHSRISIAVAAVIAVADGRRGRRAAVRSLVAVGATSAVVNLALKFGVRRPRPDRISDVAERTVRMPSSTSFPSGHAASAFAFGTVISQEYPLLTLPSQVLASAIAYARVHTGVHYPGDVIAGAMVGKTIRSAVEAALARQLDPPTH